VGASWLGCVVSLRLYAVQVLVGSSPSDASNVTVVQAAQVFSCSVTSLTENVAIVLTWSAYDVSGRSVPFHLLARPYSPSPAPVELAVKAMSNGNILLTWGPPPSLTITNLVSDGLYLSDYIVEVRTPFGAADGAWTRLALTAEASYVHEPAGASRVTLYYAVSARVSQNSSYGAATSVGQRALAQIYFGRPPAWTEGANATTPRNGSVLVVPRDGILDIQLEAFAPDAQTGLLRFRVLQALPLTAYWGVPATTSTPVSTIKQNLSLAYAPDLAGSRYSVCVTAQDAGGLEAPRRCFTLVMPRPNPRLVSAPSMPPCSCHPLSCMAS
jgi:hypothetical protein